KTVADDADVGTISDDLAQPAEKLRAEAGQLLDFRGKRQVEPAPEIGELGLLVLDLGLGEVERRRDLGKLLAQGGNRGGQLLDLRACRSARLLLAGQRLLGLFRARRQRVAFALRGLQLGGEAGGSGA